MTPTVSNKPNSDSKRMKNAQIERPHIIWYVPSCTTYLLRHNYKIPIPRLGDGRWRRRACNRRYIILLVVECYYRRTKSNYIAFYTTARCRYTCDCVSCDTSTKNITEAHRKHKGGTLQKSRNHNNHCPPRIVHSGHVKVNRWKTKNTKNIVTYLSKSQTARFVFNTT